MAQVVRQRACGDPERLSAGGLTDAMSLLLDTNIFPHFLSENMGPLCKERPTDFAAMEGFKRDLRRRVGYIANFVRSSISWLKVRRYARLLHGGM